MNKQEKKKALVTGGTGYVGSHVAKELVARGWETHIIVRPTSDLGLLEADRHQVVLHSHDGTTGNMQSILNAAKPTVVFHLASLFLAQHRPDDIVPLINSNVIFSTQLAEAMAAAGTTRMINTGTVWQHFENEDYNPVNLYAATKQAFESILTYYVQAFSFRVISLKLFDTYGPNDPRPKLFTLLRRVAKEQIPTPMSPGEQLLDLVYIDDVVNAYLAAADRLMIDGMPPCHECYAVATGSPRRLRDLVDLYSRIIAKELPIEWGRRPYRPREVMVPWNKGERLPGWRPCIDLETGIKQMEGLTK